MPNQQAAGRSDFYVTGVPQELRDELKQRTAENRESVSAVARVAFRGYIADPSTPAGEAWAALVAAVGGVA
jgi:hypothetical protein